MSIVSRDSNENRRETPELSDQRATHFNLQAPASSND